MLQALFNKAQFWLQITLMLTLNYLPSLNSILIWNGKKTHMIDSYQPFIKNGKHLSNLTLVPHSYNTNHYYTLQNQ